MQDYARTDAGKVRLYNQDYIYSSSEPVGEFSNLFVVADGMGGHRAGDYASRFAVENLVEYLRQGEHAPLVTLMKEGIAYVNVRLFQKSLENAERSGMGTTLVAATVKGSTLYAANVGDSRLYLYRGGKVRQITRDHSYVEEMVAHGKMVRGSREYMEKKHIITRALGTDYHVEADFFEEELEEGDCILLCSDGLSNMVSDEEVVSCLAMQGTLSEKVNRLIDTANQNGGGDNIAVILAEPRISEVKSC